MNSPIGYLFRHGETEGNRAGLLKGHLNFKLTDRGLAEAEEQSQFARTLGITRIFSAPLLRVLETCSFTAQELDLPIEQHYALGSWNAGMLQGCVRDEIAPVLQALIRNSDIPAPYGESIDDVEERVGDFFTSALREAARSGPFAFFTDNSALIALENMLTGKRAISYDSDGVLEPGEVAAIFPHEESYRLEPVFAPTRRAKQEQTR